MLDRVVRLSGIGGLALLVAVYALDAGHGFVKDDFNWILTSRIEQAGDLLHLFGAATGFFRPVVSLSFAIDYALFGLRPLAYGLTNLALLLASVGALIQLLRAMGLRRELAIATALLWALNFQGINMAVLWISGRTALLVTLFAVAAAWAWTRGHRLIAALLTTAAMWSKEEAFALPAILTVWSLVETRGARQTIRDTWLLWLAAVISLACRTWTGAFTPASAPELYRYQFDLMTLASNAVAYADRVATTPVLALLLFWIAAGWPAISATGAPVRSARSDAGASWNAILKGAAWLVLSLAPTILLPVRSSLYGVLPSVGVLLMVGEVGRRISARATPHGLQRAVVAVLLVFASLFPVYRARNERYVREAELSAAIVRELEEIAVRQPTGGLVVILDDRQAQPTAEQAFGPLADRAAQLVTRGKLQVWIEPAPRELASVAPPDLRSAVATLVVERGRLRQND